jgi:hypothetical protein
MAGPEARTAISLTVQLGHEANGEEGQKPLVLRGGSPIQGACHFWEVSRHPGSTAETFPSDSSKMALRLGFAQGEAKGLIC